MYREKPVANKICARKWQQREYEIHRKKLKAIKPSINNKPPNEYPHLKRNLKKLQNDRGELKISIC